MAIRLNRLEPMDEAAKNKRWKRRHALLCVLDQLPVRDEVNINSQLVRAFWFFQRDIQSYPNFACDVPCHDAINDAYFLGNLYTCLKARLFNVII